MYTHKRFGLLLLAGVLIATWAITTYAVTPEPRWDVPPRLVDEPPGFRALRARFEKLSLDQLEQAGYDVHAECVGGAALGQPELGAMGQHAVHPARYQAQFQSGTPDPHHPPIVLVANGRIVGIEWEFKNLGQQPPVLWGQTVNLGPAHPGTEEPHYMLHAFFEPDGKILFGDWNPALSCGGPAASGTPAHD